MTLLVPVALFGWVLICVLLFAFVQPTRAMIITYIGAWLFLPMASYDLPGFPQFDKTAAASVAVILGTLLFAPLSLSCLRIRWIDIPIAGICLGPLLTAIHNGLGIYEGISDMWSHLILWGVPYLAGRLYITNLSALRDLATGILIGAVVYAPLCLFEVRFSPQFHHWCYGFHQHSFAQHIRYGGFRPMVFMQHGLMVAFWMSAGTIVGYWLWRGTWMLRRMPWIMPVIVSGLALTTVLCKSGNALILMPVGISSYHICRLGFGRPLLLALVLVPVAWMGSRVFGVIPSEPVVAAVSYVDADRALSLGARLEQEELFGEKASKRLVLGWGRWGRMFPLDERGEKMTRGVDGLWTITLGQYGLLGLVSTVALILLGSVRVMLNSPVQRIAKGNSDLLLFLFAVLACLCMVDCIFNAMVNPIFLVASAGLAAIPLGASHSVGATVMQRRTARRRLREGSIPTRA